ncbi:hypothetical protein Tco_1307895 [Tanacetum coccineum]
MPELAPSVWNINASHCTSLRKVSGSSKDLFRDNYFENCPQLIKNTTIDSERSISKTECLDSSITSQGFIHQLSAFRRYMGFHTNKSEFFLKAGPDLGLCRLAAAQGPKSLKGLHNIFLPNTGHPKSDLDIVYHGNSVPELFTNKSMENHVKVELPLDWCYDKFRGYGTFVVFKRKKPCKFKGFCVKNFDGASLTLINYFLVLVEEYFHNEVIGIHESYMIWLQYMRDTWEWKEAKNFVTFCLEENNEDVEVKEWRKTNL